MAYLYLKLLNINIVFITHICGVRRVNLVLYAARPLYVWFSVIICYENGL
jgi:hypothetical protein